MKLLLTFSLLLSILSTRAQDTTRKIQDTTRKDDPDKTFIKLEIEATYPGGTSSWLRFLNRNLRFPDDAISNNIQGDIMVQFIVDKEGNTSDIQAISGPQEGGLRQEAIRMIRISGKWVPGIQNGRQVRSYKKQVISFRIDGK
jgi:periplasmic protein TonB